MSSFEFTVKGGWHEAKRGCNVSNVCSCLFNDQVVKPSKQSKAAEK